MLHVGFCKGLGAKHLKGVWRRPRETLQDIVETNPRRLFLPLASAWCTYVVVHGVVAGDPETYSGALVGLVAAGVALFSTYFYLFAYLLARVGQMLGGRGSSDMARAVMAWSCVPYIPLLLIDVSLLVLGGDALIAYTLREVRHGAAGWGLIHKAAWAELVSRAVMTMWSYVIYVKGYSQVFELSVTRSLCATFGIETLKIGFFSAAASGIKFVLS